MIDVPAFLDAYVAAFDALDPQRIARMYADPSAIYSGEGRPRWSTREALVASMASLCRAYSAMGYERATHELVERIPMGDKAAFILVRWTLHLVEGGPVCFRAGYQLAVIDEEAQVVFVTAFQDVA